MRFTVANWHTKSAMWWVEHNAYTTMASPPLWAKGAKRNLPLFAPPPEIVFGHYNEEAYTKIYGDVLKERLPKIREWIDIHNDEHVILLCACPDGQFCHRLLIAKLLIWLGCEEIELEPQPAGTIKALSLNQPWATLIAIGAKRVETRSWGTSYRGMLAIHASKTFSSADQETAQYEPFHSDLAKAGYRTIEAIPRGALLAITDLIDCVKMTWEWIDTIDEKEREYGLYSEGRYAWIFSGNVKRFEQPIPARGSLGLWNWAPIEGEAVK